MDTRNVGSLLLRLWTLYLFLLRRSGVIFAAPVDLQGTFAFPILRVTGVTDVEFQLPQKVNRRAPRASLPTPYASCETVEKWSTIDEARDVFGSEVKVLQTFSQDGTLIQQNFFERYCANDERSPAKLLDETISQFNRCKGVDESKYHGFCRTRQTYSYAKVENSKGTVGWTRIAIRGGCECALFDKVQSDISDILRYLRH